MIRKGDEFLSMEVQNTTFITLVAVKEALW